MSYRNSAFLDRMLSCRMLCCRMLCCRMLS